MKTLFFYLLIFFLIWFLGAVMHEADLSRNFKEEGDAKAWYFETKNLLRLARDFDTRLMVKEIAN